MYVLSQVRAWLDAPRIASAKSGFMFFEATLTVPGRPGWRRRESVTEEPPVPRWRLIRERPSGFSRVLFFDVWSNPIYADGKTTYVADGPVSWASDQDINGGLLLSSLLPVEYEGKHELSLLVRSTRK